MLTEVIEHLSQYPQERVLFLGSEVESLEEINNIFPGNKNIISANYLNTSLKAQGALYYLKREELSEQRISIKLEDNLFDIVYLNSIIHHLPDDTNLFEQLKVLLKPGGVVFVVELYRDGNQSDKKQTFILQHHFQAEVDMKKGRIHNFTFKREEILGYLKKKGLVNAHVADFGDIFKMNSDNKINLQLVVEGVKKSIHETEDFTDYKLFQKIGYETLSRIENIGFSMPNQLVVTATFL